MSQIASLSLNTTWKPFSEIITPEDDVNYYIQNRGSDFLIACEGDPQSDEGIFVKPYELLKYKKGSQSLYLRASSSNCTINVSNEG